MTNALQGERNHLSPRNGDETLVGTQLQVISQRQERHVVSKFQLTSAIGLERGDADALEQALVDQDAAEVMAILTRAGHDDPRFLAVLNAAVDETTLFSHSNSFLGKDGFPDLWPFL